MTSLHLPKELERFRERLLDLSLRNPLLNYRKSVRRTVQIVDILPDRLYERLVTEQKGYQPEPLVEEEEDEEDEGNLVTITDVNAAHTSVGEDALRTAAGRFEHKHSKRVASEDEPTGTPRDKKDRAIRRQLFPVELPGPSSDRGGEIAGPAHRLQTNLSAARLRSTLRYMHRESRNAIEETGINYLHLALGFLRWTEADSSSTSKLAPLILIPVRIESVLDRRIGQQKSTVVWNEEDVASNLCLIKLLEKNYGIALDEYSPDQSPEDYFREVQRITKSKRGWGICREALLGFFSFHKLSMYSDLAPENWKSGNALSESSLSGQLIGGANTEAASALYAADYDLHNHASAGDIALPLDADSSQHSALCDIHDGRTLVIEGPPGTGKSQTITNAIANAISHGKTVLFVSEKLAALEVVAGRLAKLGLDDFCLKLHSDASTPRLVFESLRSRLERKARMPKEMSELRSELTLQQEEIDSYLTATETPIGPRRRPLYEVFWQLVEMRSQGLVSLREAELDTSLDMRQFLRASQELESFAAALGEFPSPRESPWWGFFPSSLNPNNCDPVESALRAMVKTLDAFSGTAEELASKLGGDSLFWLEELSRIDLAIFERIAEAPPSRSREQIADLQIPECRKQGTALLNDIGGYQQLTEQLNATLLVEPKNAADQLAGLQATVSDRCQHFPKEVTLAELRERRVWHRTTLTYLEQLKEAAEAMEKAGLGPARTINEYKRARTVLQLVLHPCVHQPGTVTPQLFLEAAKKTFRDAHATADKLAKREADLSEVFHMPSVPDRDALLEIVSALRPHVHSVLRVFRREYRTAMAQIRRFARVDCKRSPEQWVNAVESLESIEEEKRKFREAPELIETFGSAFQGIDTAWDSLRTLFDWVHTAKKHGLDYERANMLLDARYSNAIGVSPAKTKELLTAVSEQFASESASKLIGIGTERWEDLPLENLKLRLEETESAISRLESASQLFSSKESTRLSEISETSNAIARWGEIRDRVFESANWPPLSAEMHSALLGDPDQGRTDIDWFDASEASGLSDQAIRHILESNPVESCRFVVGAAWAVRTALAEWDEARGILGQQGQVADEWLRVKASAVATGELREQLERLLSSLYELPAWAALSRTLTQCERLGLAHFTAAAIDSRVAPGKLAATFELTLLERLADEAIDSCPELQGFARQRLETARERYQQLDVELRNLACEEVAYRASRRQPPAGNNRGRVGEFTELALIKHEVQKQKRHCRIRDLMVRAGASVQALKPCFMMSPLSVAQAIPAGTLEFDLVIMDEASQIKPEDALGTILRAHQLVVVGDPKQLPPTSFFDRIGEEVDDDDSTQFDNAESILEVAMKVFQPFRRLRWHYRSSHEGLISFSNSRFYDEDLVIFPSPSANGGMSGVKHHFVDNAFFSSGVNLKEAEAVVAAILEHAKRDSGETLGVGTFNKAQADAIQDLLDRQCASDSRARAALERLNSGHEQLFIKNLENLQGDERDVIFISYTYGPDPQSGRVMQRFGPINSSTGWRRLNVLVTRSRKRMEVFSSLLSSDVVGGPEKSQGVNAYKDFLEFSVTGKLVDRGDLSGRDCDSPFESAVCRVVESMGLEAVPQVGVAGFFIDIGVRSRSSPGEFLIGIECDGAAYHSSRSARDRDRLREEIIRSRGWNLHRIWSTDWYLNQRHEENRLRRAIEAACGTVAELTAELQP
ncbi:DUF4011 domain-containing protein [Candidatus Laterigemmans baculatus]|uniref:DUF4011 domain-containing protein n=1 Tax=Candidatus Laterigemmans baculatus TaxID=2770505 RepID=UPI0013DB2D8B|nr:DUF4011 domain-containing protein [Candidatus Laterigemmans baculatus]